MTKQDDFIVEIHTEELPPKALLKLAENFCEQIRERLQKADLEFESIHFYATPRRLAVAVKRLAASTPGQMVERRGPARKAAFNEKGEPSPACVGFAKSCGVVPAELQVITTPQGEWVGYTQSVPGKSIFELLPTIVEQAALALPVPKRMRWGAGEAQFVRPVHSVLMMYGNKVVAANIIGCSTGNQTRGHRFHAPEWITLTDASEYLSSLEKQGHVIADFNQRKKMIIEQTEQHVQKALGKQACVWMETDLVDEVTGLVEWPEVLIGKFESDYLALPQEVLISSMQDHQRYFPVMSADNTVDADQECSLLLPYFVTISNIHSENVERVRHGNERVLRARLADAAFFYAADKQESLEQRLSRLKGMVFQAKLGTLYEKAERISRLAGWIAEKIGAHVNHAKRAGLLSKADLTTQMVNEFPELQGVMGGYYAMHDEEGNDIAFAIREHYMPRFAGDETPKQRLGQVVALADRIDSLVGTFGINQIPTGDKDPFGLRRAALGVLRILIEKQINLDLKEALSYAAEGYVAKLENVEVVPQVLNFIQERLRAWYVDHGVSADVFASVAALGISNPLDANERIKAVQAFKKLSAAETLSIANKRVSNILSKYMDGISAKQIDPTYFENAAEQELAQQLDAKSQTVMQLSQSGQYAEVLMQLSELRKPIDDFFDQVMVMTEDQSRRENRLLLLTKLRALFLQVADIALLQ